MNKARASLQHFRHQLANYEALPQLVLLGLICGLGSGLLISLLRLAIDLPLLFLLPEHVENFEGLPATERFLLPLLGCLLLAILFSGWSLMRCKVGIVHLMERLAYHQGVIPIKHLFAQFISACIALISGQSVGREGPAVYIGACFSSWIGQLLHIPHNSLRLLLACGSAAAISAAFNTPLAGVVFAMEVILLEYTVAGFTPVIVASVSASLVTRILFDGAPIFDVPSFTIASINEVPWVLATGAAIGVIATVFIKLMLFATKSKAWVLPLRLILAGFLTGLVAIAYPQVMGTGYDTISDALWGRLELSIVIVILLAKLLLTPLILGLGIPAGLIGPVLFIGALAGSAMGIIGGLLVDGTTSHIGLYAMLGMGSMMAAVLNAPLAALVALLELTYNPNIIFPAMMAIVTSNLLVRYCVKTPSIFLASLQAQGLDYRQEPLAQALSRASVASVMSRKFVTTANAITRTNAQQLIEQDIQWLVLSDTGQANTLLACLDLANFHQRHVDLPDAEIDLLRIPAERHQVVRLSERSTLFEALNLLNQQQAKMLCICDGSQQIVGLLSKTQITDYYSQKQHM